MTLNRRRQKLYTANTDGESVSIVDLVSNNVIHTIHVGNGYSPGPGWFSEEADKFYCGADGLWIVDGGGDTVIEHLEHLGTSAVTGSQAHALVALTHSYDSVAFLDQFGDTLISVLPVGQQPEGLTWSRRSDLVYCANSVSGSVSIIAGNGRHGSWNARGGSRALEPSIGATGWACIRWLRRICVHTAGYRKRASGGPRAAVAATRSGHGASLPVPEKCHSHLPSRGNSCFKIGSILRRRSIGQETQPRDRESRKLLRLGRMR